MNTCVIYYSKFGHTHQVSESIAAAFLTNGSVKLTEAMDLTADDFRDIDLMVMGCPTHKMNMPEDLKPLCKQLPRKCMQGKNCAVFDTSYEMSAFLNRFTASKKLKSKLRKLGGKIVVNPETFIVEGRKGPLRAGELERAAEWGNLIRQQI